MGDANWFFSACAQTAGAIVAIVGGFLVTRLVTISAERKGVRQSLVLARRRLESAQARKDEAEQEMRDWEIKRFKNAVVGAIVEADERWTPEILMQRYGGVLLSEDDLRNAIAETAECAERAYDAFKILDDDTIADLEYEEATPLLDEVPSLAERYVFEAMFEELRSEARTRIRQASPLYAAQWLTPMVVPIQNILTQRGEEEQLRRRHIEAKIEADRAESDVDILETQEARTQDPSGLLAAWVILTYLSVVGVAFPLALLPAGENVSKWKAWILGLFLAGVAALLGYFLVMGVGAIVRKEKPRS